MGVDKLRELAIVLVDRIRKNVSIDWNLKVRTSQSFYWICSLNQHIKGFGLVLSEVYHKITKKLKYWA